MVIKKKTLYSLRVNRDFYGTQTYIEPVFEKADEIFQTKTFSKNKPSSTTNTNRQTPFICYAS